MNSTKKNIRKTSGTRKRYKPGQLFTIDHHVYQFTKGPCSMCKITKDIWLMSTFCHICPPVYCVKIIK